MDIRCTKCVNKVTVRNTKRVLELCGLSFEKFDKLVNDSIAADDYSSFSEYLKSFVYKMISTNFSLGDVERMESILDNYYIMRSAKNFILSLDSVNKCFTDGYSIDFNALDRLGDFCVDFSIGSSFAPISLKVCKLEHTMSSKAHKDMTAWAISLLYFDSDADKLTCEYTFFVTDQLVNRYLTDGVVEQSIGASDECRGCMYRVPLDIAVDNSCDVNYCMTCDRKIEKGKCRAGSNIMLPFKEAVKVVAYVVLMYQNRSSVERKNGKYSAQYKERKVCVAQEVNGEEKLLSLKQYYNYERTKKEWQGGHHSSPAEHERRAHERVYRNPDGSVKRIVQVKKCVVNKGGVKAVYKI